MSESQKEKQTKHTVGTYLAQCLQHVGIRDYFAIPGDFNLVLLDELLKNKSLRLVGCCNELNAGYAADGYARANGVSALVVTYSVGALSAINAVAGAYAEDQPVVVIVGGPNTNSQADGEYIHHTLGELRYDYCRKMFAEVTAVALTIQDPVEAPQQIHHAISMCLQKRKPVYIEIACNISSAEVSSLSQVEVPSPLPSLEHLQRRVSDPSVLSAAVRHAAQVLNSALKPVIVGGTKLRQFWGGIPAGGAAVETEQRSKANHFLGLVDSAKYAVAMMPDAKGCLPEDHPSFAGIYWGPVSIGQATKDVVESADAYLFVGPIFNDYNTCGHSIKINKSSLVQVDTDCVRIGTEMVYHDVFLSDFLRELAKSVKPNDSSLREYRQRVEQQRGGGGGATSTTSDKSTYGYFKGNSDEASARVSMNRLRSVVQNKFLHKANTINTILAETGEAWFTCMKLQVPANASFEIQMEYGSIGWSVGAALGYSIAMRSMCTPAPEEGESSGDLQQQQQMVEDDNGHHRVIVLIGDGSFQLTAQEVSTMIRYRTNPILFVLNNSGYTIEEEIHAGSYNNIQNWNYAELVRVFNTKKSDSGWGCRVTTNAELDEAVEIALKNTCGPSLIEVVLDRDDCSNELKVWGKHVSASNSRKKAPPSIEQLQQEKKTTTA